MTAAKFEQMRTLVIGATGLVGGHLLRHLLLAGARPLALSRSPRGAPGIDWRVGDLQQPATLVVPPVETLFCTAGANLLADALGHFLTPSLKRVVAFTSTSILTKLYSEVAAERTMLANLARAEQNIVRLCTDNNVEWTILRPTLIYDAGHDTNITPLSQLIRRFGFMPLVGGGTGLRQPVHAEDLAIGAISAASSPSAANKFYSLPGGETITYREMIGRIFDGVGLPRRTIAVPHSLWKAGFVFAQPLFPGANVAMGTRMTKDMVFDPAPAARDFGWSPRTFHPTFT